MNQSDPFLLPDQQSQGADPFLLPDQGAGHPDQSPAHVQVNVSPEAMNHVQQAVGDHGYLHGIAGGLRDAVVNTGHLAADIGGGVVNFVTGSGWGDELISKPVHEGYSKVPEVEHSTSPGAEFTRDLTKFGLGFIGGQKLLKGLGAGAGFATDTAAGAVGDFAVTSKEDHTLAQTTLNSLVEDYPQLAGPVVDFLRSPSDSDTEQRFKTALEGVVLGSAASGVFKMVKYIKGSLPGAAADGQALKALQQGEEGATAAEAHAAASGAEETVKAADGSQSANTALLDEAAQDFAKAQAEPHQLEMFPELVRAHVGSGAEEKIGQQVAEQAGRDVVPPEAAGQGWNTLKTFRMDEGQKATFLGNIARNVQDGKWVGDLNRSELPSDVFNFRTMTSRDEVVGTLDDFTRVVHEGLAKTTGGPESFAEVGQKTAMLLSDMVGAKGTGDVFAPLAHMAGDAKQITARFIAAKEMMQSMTGDIVRIAEAIDNGTGGKTAEFELLRRMDILQDLTATVKGAQTAAARITSAGRIRTTDTLSPEELVSIISQHGGSDSVQVLARRLRAAGNDPAAVRKVVEGSWLNRAVDVHNEVWMNGVLSGVKTHLVNMSSALANTALRPAEKIIGGGLDLGYQSARSALGFAADTATSRRQIAEGMATYSGMRMAVMDSLEAAAKSFKMETALLDPSYRSVDGFTHAIGTGDGKVLADGALGRGLSGDVSNLWADNGLGGNMLNAFGQFIRMPSRFLTAEDEFFKQLNYRAYVYAQATQEAIEKGLSSARNIPAMVDGKPRMLSQVDQYISDKFTKAFAEDGRGTVEGALRWAQESTFTQDLKASTWLGGPSLGQSVSKLANAHPVLRSVILPFVRTPVNLMRNAMDHTPGIAQLRKQFYEDITAGGERRAMALGKLSTGSVMWTAAMLLASEGKIVGNGPADPQLNAAWRSDGKLPYSFVVTKDDGSKEYVQFSKLDPFASFLGMAADVHDIMSRMDQGTRENLAVSLSVALANNVSNKTYLKGLTQTLSLISNGAMNREQAMKNAMYQRVASYIPAYASLYNDDVELKEVRSVVDAIAQKVPGWSSSVEAKRDMFGEKQLYPEGWLGKALNPLTVSDQTSDPVRQEIARLAGSSAGKAFLPVPHKDGNINLLDWQNAKGQTAYDRLMELHGSTKIGGKTMHDRMGDLIQSDLYQQKLHDGTELYPNSKRVELVNNLRTTYRQVAMQQLLKEFPEIAAAVRVDQVNRAKAAVYGKAGVQPLPTPGAVQASNPFAQLGRQ